jgi:hypothetical protein
MDGPAKSYIPAIPPPDPGPSLEYVREHGKIVHYGPNNVAAVETTVGQTVFYHAVRLNDDGTIKEFMRTDINKYVRIKVENHGAPPDDPSFGLVE